MCACPPLERHAQRLLDRQPAVEDDPPRIGITTLQNLQSREMRRSRGLAPELSVDLQYARALWTVGATPILIAPVGRASDLPLAQLDGLCFPGGPDLDPAVYSATRHHLTTPAEVEADRYEVELVHKARERQMPILGICRGAQIINVAFGGTLAQHLADGEEVSVQHHQTGVISSVTHRIEAVPGQRIASLLPSAVNSRHHQAITELGDGVVAVAHAPDGVIEACEIPDGPFLFGMQWHAEYLVHTPSHRLIIETFVDACLQRRKECG